MNDGDVPRRRGRSRAHRAARSRRATSTRLDDDLDARARARADEARPRGGAAVDRRWSATRPTCCPSWSRRGVVPDVLTDQTTAHDPLARLRARTGMSLDEAARRCARRDPSAYVARVAASDGRARARRCSSCSAAARSRSTTATTCAARRSEAGVADAFDFPGFVPAYIRPLFCEGKGPFRWVALSGDPDDIARTDEAVLELFPDDAALRAGSAWRGERVAFQGLPARICWLGYGERARSGCAFNELVARRRGSRRRSSSAATTSTAARWPRPTARPRR